MEQALQADSPLALNFTPDEDMAFSTYAAQVWGPYLSTWREKQMKAVTLLSASLRTINDQLVRIMVPYVRQVAEDRFPAGIAAAIVLLRWPDRKLAQCFVEGFPIIGEVEESGIFRRLSDTGEDVKVNDIFFGLIMPHKRHFYVRRNSHFDFISF